MITNVYLPDVSLITLSPIKVGRKWLWANHKTIRLVVFRDGVPENIYIPSGSMSNFASIPLPFKWFLKKSDPSQAIPAFIHDQLVGEYAQQVGDLTWEESADVFNILLLQMKAKYRRTLVTAVKIYGKFK